MASLEFEFLLYKSNTKKKKKKKNFLVSFMNRKLVIVFRRISGWLLEIIFSKGFNFLVRKPDRKSVV